MQQKRNQSYTPATQKTEAIAEWESLRFGAFVHFNDNTCLVREFSKNTDPAVFNPVNLDFDSMMTTFHEVGVKYAVLTNCHTSGFSLWDSKVTQFDVASSPFKKDVVRLFIDACRKHNIKPCLYYCLWGSKDWNPVTWNPTIKTELEKQPRNKSFFRNWQSWLKTMATFMLLQFLLLKKWTFICLKAKGHFLWSF